MEYSQRRPEPTLASFIHCYWFLSGSGATTQLQPIVPDGRMELIVNVADRFRRHHGDGTVERQPSCVVAGQITEYVLVEPGGTVDLVGVRFTAPGAAALGFPAGELRGRIVDADAVSRALHRDLGERLFHAHDVAARRRVLDAHFLGMLDRARAPDAVASAAVDRITASAGRVDLDEVAAHVSVSRRTLERRFDAAVGLAPKVFARITRFQRALRLMQSSGPGSWTRVAHSCGYFDQAHLNREFRTFTGTSPSKFFSGQTTLADFFSREDA